MILYVRAHNLMLIGGESLENTFEDAVLNRTPNA
jgi:hypothetical protein